MGRKRAAEKNKKIAEQIKNGTAIATKDAEGRRCVRALNDEKKQVRRSFLGTRIFYNCPRCGKPLQYKKKMHQGLCMSCGQRLDWTDYDNMACVWLEVHDAEEAGYWGSQYEKINGTLYGIDYEQWRLSMTRKSYPMVLFFPFPCGKDYGRFMRKAAKEATIIKEVKNESAI